MPTGRRHLRRNVVPAAVQATLEPLEKRELLSAFIEDRVLEVRGTPGDDVIAIWAAPRARYTVDVNGQRQTFARSAVRTVRVLGGAGNDRIHIASKVAARHRVKLLVNGGPGDNVLTGLAARFSERTISPDVDAIPPAVEPPLPPAQPPGDSPAASQPSSSESVPPSCGDADNVLPADGVDADPQQPVDPTIDPPAATEDQQNGHDPRDTTNAEPPAGDDAAADTQDPPAAVNQPPPNDGDAVEVIIDDVEEVVVAPDDDASGADFEDAANGDDETSPVVPAPEEPGSQDDVETGVGGNGRDDALPPSEPPGLSPPVDRSADDTAGATDVADAADPQTPVSANGGQDGESPPDASPEQPVLQTPEPPADPAIGTTAADSDADQTCGDVPPDETPTADPGQSGQPPVPDDSSLPADPQSPAGDSTAGATQGDASSQPTAQTGGGSVAAVPLNGGSTGNGNSQGAQSPSTPATDPQPPAVQSPQQPAFMVWDALGYANQPSFASLGLTKVYLTDREFLAGSWPNYDDTKPNETRTRILARKVANLNVPLILDVEHWPIDIRKTPLAEVQANLAKLHRLVDWLRDERPGLKIGFYDLLPQGDYWTPYMYVTAQERISEPWWRGNLPKFRQAYLDWQAANDYLRPLAEKVDFFCPSLYTYYDDQDGWRKFALANIEEAKRYGKPVLPFLWSEYHDSNAALKYTELPADYWRMQLNFVRQHADGMVLWGGWDLKNNRAYQWNESARWWTVVKGFLNTVNA